jgi:hypothetical protein
MLIFAHAYFCPRLFLLKRRQLLAIGEEFGAFLVVDAIDAEHLAAHEAGGGLLADGSAEYALVEGGHLGRVEAVILGAGREGRSGREGGDDGQGVQDFHGFRSKIAFRVLVAPKAEAVQRLGDDVSFEIFG